MIHPSLFVRSLFLLLFFAIPQVHAQAEYAQAKRELEQPECAVTSTTFHKTTWEAELNAKISETEQDRKICICNESNYTNAVGYLMTVQLDLPSNHPNPYHSLLGAHCMVPIFHQNDQCGDAFRCKNFQLIP